MSHIVVKAHLLLVLDVDELGGSGVRDFGPAGPSIRLPLNYLTYMLERFFRLQLK